MCLSRKLKDSLDINEIADYLEQGASLHPLLYDYYLEHLEELSFKDKITLLPHTILELYAIKCSRKFANLNR